MGKWRWWTDGPRWPWLCRIFGHQMEWSCIVRSGELYQALQFGGHKDHNVFGRKEVYDTYGGICGRCGATGIRID